MKIAVKFLIALGLSLLLVWAVRTYAFTVFTVPAGGLPPQLKAGNRVIVNRIDCDFFNRGDVVVFTDSVFAPAKKQAQSQAGNQGESQAQPQARKFVSEAYFIGRIEKLAGRYDSCRYGEFHHPYGMLQALRLQGLPLLSPEDANRAAAGAQASDDRQGV